MRGIFTTLAILLSVAATVRSHGVLTGVSGANGVNAIGFAVVEGTPRDTGRGVKKVEVGLVSPGRLHCALTILQGDTSIIRDKEIKSGKVQGCGRTEFGGNTDVATSLAGEYSLSSQERLADTCETAASAAGLPSAAADGSVTMTLHQVNGDGAGPYACDVSASGSATDFVAMQVTQNVPGQNSRSKNKATNFTLIAQMPAGTACTGGPGGDACVVRCRNSAAAGPFGGCAAGKCTVRHRSWVQWLTRTRQ
jgi:hypothetical protein